MKKIKVILLSIALFIAVGISAEKMSVNAEVGTGVTSPAVPQLQYKDVNALEIVSNPYRFLKRNIRIRAKFDKFSTLGLDYAPAMRSSENYISFLIQRPDITNHNIPLSELKIFLKKDVAEKNIDLDAGDEVEFTGRVFSTALGDAWMEVDDFKVINKIKKAEKAEKVN